MPDQLDPANDEVTDNHNLPKIPELDQDYNDEWGFVLNRGEFADGTDAGSDALITALEERVVVRDLQSEVTSYTPHDDALFYATDTGRIYLGDGSSWTAQSFGTSAEPVPGTSHFEALSTEQTEIGGTPLGSGARLETKGVQITDSDVAYDIATVGLGAQVKFIAKYGNDVNASSRYGITEIFFASTGSGFVTNIEEKVTGGINLNYSWGGQTLQAETGNAANVYLTVTAIRGGDGSLTWEV